MKEEIPRDGKRELSTLVLDNQPSAAPHSPMFFLSVLFVQSKPLNTPHSYKERN